MLNLKLIAELAKNERETRAQLTTAAQAYAQDAIFISDKLEPEIIAMYGQISSIMLKRRRSKK